ncbi:MAG: ATP-binding protein [Dongiaceae bacterium]
MTVSLLTYGLLTFIQYQALGERTVEFAQYSHRLLTEVMTQRIEDVLITGRKIDIDRTLLDTVHVTQTVNRQTIGATDSSDLAGRVSIAAFAVFGADGQLLKAYDSPFHRLFPVQRLSELVLRAIRTGHGVDELSDDVDVIVQLVQPPNQGSLTGVVAIAWDMESHYAAVRATTIKNAIHGAVATLAMIALLLMVIYRWITRPISDLSRHFTESGQSGELGFVDETLAGRRDEIGVLAVEFNKMVETLADSRQKLQNQSYVTGMAEMASGVLHNIRNALNPISVGIWKLEETARNGSTGKIEAALAELAAPDTPVERRLKLTDYVRAAAEKLTAQQVRFANDIRALGEHSRHIEHILQDVDLTGRRRGANEPVNLDKLAEDCARMIPNQAGSPIAVEIDPALARLPAATGNRLTITQVIGNLMVNAAEAIRATAVPAGRIEVAGRAESVDGKDMIHLEIRDNGDGIPPELMDSLFRRGFSTKSEKKGGIGLHWCANSVIAMGGKIYATSEGKGRGAAFHLLLPAAPRRTTESKQSAA